LFRSRVAGGIELLGCHRWTPPHPASGRTGWEVAAASATPDKYVPSRMRSSGTQPLLITHAHTLRVAELPDHCGDPFYLT